MPRYKISKLLQDNENVFTLLEENTTSQQSPGLLNHVEDVEDRISAEIKRVCKMHCDTLVNVSVPAELY